METTTEIRDTTVWRVQSGGRCKWFAEQADARDYANDRFDTEIEGVPFLDEVTLSEALTRLNGLEGLGGHEIM